MKQSISIACALGTQQQTRRTLLQQSINGTDRQTDRHLIVTKNLPNTM